MKFALFLLMMFGQLQPKTSTMTLTKWPDADLGTLKPLVISKDGAYGCPYGFDMYVKTRTSDRTPAFIRVEPLKKVRFIESTEEFFSIICVEIPNPMQDERKNK